MNIKNFANQVKTLCPEEIENVLENKGNIIEIQCKTGAVCKLSEWLFDRQVYHFVGLVVEESHDKWNLSYLFKNRKDVESVLISAKAPINERSFKSISNIVHAADWHEREAEDLFGLIFEGHPKLGDFILHDDAWQEGVDPMRKGFDMDAILADRRPRENWRPKRIVRTSGAFIMPVGPVFSGEAESVHFQLETIGEEVLCAFPRLFFKYRGVEKMAEGRSTDEALLLAERFAGNTSFSHALAFCMSIEQLAGLEEVPKRAQVLRVFLAELERLRYHLGTIESICNSTGLVVAANQVGILEEEALRIAGALTGHRYLFGLLMQGGLSRDFDDHACSEAAVRARGIIQRLEGIEKLLINTSSFLDRIEEVGIITRCQAQNYGLVGPVAKGSGYCNDIRVLRPYSGYDEFDITPTCEREGDGYARLRVFFNEARQAVSIMEQAVQALPALSGGHVSVPCNPSPGRAVACVETPRGTTWHWVRIDEQQKITRYRLITPSFVNWHGFHLATENFAFQDFPIILATMGLSVAENDR